MFGLLNSVVSAFVLSLAILAGSAASAGEQKTVVLTVDGLGVPLSFSIEDLDEIGTVSFETTTIWTDGLQQFRGVPLPDFLDHLGVESGTMVATAVNDYSVSIPVDEASQDGPIIAFERNGAFMKLRDKGPLWIVYPYDSSEDFQTEVAHSRSIWQLERIRFEKGQ
ncbi:hypothetical protein SAMN05444714_1313 [Yoonia litorea]|uniref:Oxidoreductase molybdopterin-binding domain-containing protein n=1 Tax=Yoonia litorea TaxID=1123755 RepID=A0A1I6M6T7_9RHOB|nr:hypothetical protein SAMN05444714_1313 [Yoonia litorea]